MYNLAQGLSNLNHSITVITHNKAPEQLKGVKIVQVEIPRIPGRLKRKLFQWRWEPHYTWSKRAWECFNNLLKEYFFDIIETAEYGAWAKYFIGNLRIPIVVKCHTPAYVVREIPLNGDTKWNMPLWLAIENMRERRQTVLADGICSPSYALSGNISMNWRLPCNRIMVIPNPVDTDFFRPLENAKGGDTARKKEILYVGRLQYYKGVFDLIESVKSLLEEHPDLIVRFIGQDLKIPNHMSRSGIMASQEILSRVSKKHRHRIIITGKISHSELVSMQQKALCAVVPRQGIRELSIYCT